MTGRTRWATRTFSTIALLAGLAAATAARADDAAVFGCRADDQSTEISTDCDTKAPPAQVKIKKPPPPPTTPPVILFSIIQGEGDKHDHDRDHDVEGGSQGRDGKDSPR